MSLYTVRSKIARFAIIKPKMPLHQWIAKQSDKPDILLNASLYKSATSGIGTFYEDGKLTQNSGNGFGVGNIVNKPGDIQFGTPFDGTKWYDYLTGYYGLIQNGKKIDPPWNDAYVFGVKNKRIAIGKMKDGSICIVTHDSADIKAFREYAYNQGCVDLVNLDGGGSVSLYWQGKQIAKSTRTPYNAIAIWLEHESTNQGGKDIVKVKCVKRSQVYDVNGRLESGRYIDPGDICDLYPTVESATIQIKIVYPSGSTKRLAYVKDLSAFKAV